MTKISTIIQAPAEPPASAEPSPRDVASAPQHPDSPPRVQAVRWMALVALVSLVILIALMQRAGLRVDPIRHGNLPFYLFVGAALVARVILPRIDWRYGGAVADAAEYFAAFGAIGLIGAVASYPISALTHGYSDPVLQRIDLALGFDWLAWYRAVAASPVLQMLGTAAYRSIYVSPAMILAYYAFTGQRAQAYRLFMTFWLAAVTTLTLFWFMPAVGPFAYLWHAPIAYMPESELWQPDLIPRLRAHTLHVVDLGNLRGLVSAPSFHAAAAVIYIAAAWPIRRLRWPLLALNVAMLFSTPVEGTHYLADILLGMAVAAGAVAVMSLAVRVTVGK